MPPANTTITTTPPGAPPPTASKIPDFFKPRSVVKQKSSENKFTIQTDSKPPQPCNPSPVERAVLSEEQSLSFTINRPLPPKRLVLKAVEIETRQVDPEEEFFINPDEFEVESASRITSPTGRVVYNIRWKDGHTAEVPVSEIYQYVSEDYLEKLENDCFRHNKNPETIYDDDPDYPGGAPSGGTLAYEKGWRKQARPRMAPEERRMRMQMRLGDRAVKRQRRRQKSRASSPGYRPSGYKPTGRPRGRPTMRIKPGLAKVKPLPSTQKGAGGDGNQRARLYVNEEEEETELEDESEMEEEEQEITYEDELAAQLAADASFSSRDGAPMSVSGDPPQKTPIQFVIPPSDGEDSDSIDSPNDTQMISSPAPSSSLKRKEPPSPNGTITGKKLSLPFSPVKLNSHLLPNARAFVNEANSQLDAHQVPITSMLKRFSSSKKNQTPDPKNRVPTFAPQLPSGSPYAGVASRPSTSSSVTSFAASHNERSTSSKDTSKGKYTQKQGKVSRNVSEKGQKEQSFPPVLSSITLATPSKSSSPSLKSSKLSFTPVGASSFYGNGTKSTKPANPVRTSATAAEPKSTNKLKRGKEKSAFSKKNLSVGENGNPSKFSRESKNSSSRSDSLDDIEMQDATPPPRYHPGFNPGDYEEFFEVDYVVEKILGFRREQGRKLYLVKWEGYPVEQSTWEPVENLEGSKEVVDEFERNRLRGG